MLHTYYLMITSMQHKESNPKTYEPGEQNEEDN